MKSLIEIILKQLFTLYIGGAILFIYYKIIGNPTTYNQILNEVDPKTQVKKYAYKAFYLGIGFLIILVIVIAKLFQ